QDVGFREGGQRTSSDAVPVSRGLVLSSLFDDLEGDVTPGHAGKAAPRQERLERRLVLCQPREQDAQPRIRRLVDGPTGVERSSSQRVEIHTAPSRLNLLKPNHPRTSGKHLLRERMPVLELLLQCLTPSDGPAAKQAGQEPQYLFKEPFALLDDRLDPGAVGV